MSRTSRAISSYQKALRASLHHKFVLSRMVLFALSLVCHSLPLLRGGRRLWKRHVRHREQEVCLEYYSKGQHYATVPLPDVPVPSRHDPSLGPVAP